MPFQMTVREGSRISVAPAAAGEEPSLGREPMEDAVWRELLSALERDLSLCNRSLMHALARRIEQIIRELDSTMEGYCSLTCPTCEDPCCQGRNVFYNHTDLLYLLSLGQMIPPGQTRRQPEDPCRYLGSHGCTLPRPYRPYVCVWFLCEPQMDLFLQEPAGFQRNFISAMQNIRTLRLELYPPVANPPASVRHDDPSSRI